MLDGGSQGPEPMLDGGLHPSRHHFIRDHQQKRDICKEIVGTKDQLANIFTKPLDEERFCKLRNELNTLDFSNMC
jgi:hypothetical protein